MAHIKNQLNIYTAHTVPDWQNGKNNWNYAKKSSKKTRRRARNCNVIEATKNNK